MHLVAYLEPGRCDREIEAAAARAGLVARAISRFYRARPPRPGLMLGFSGFPRQVIMPAATRLVGLIAKLGEVGH
jgi:GntR family transcriptional regulator / MocR family aminotransferase